MEHPINVEKYRGSLNELAKDVGNMKYDSLAYFLDDFGKYLIEQAKSDRERGRTQLAEKLELTAKDIFSAKEKVWKIWKLCEPYMKK